MSKELKALDYIMEIYDKFDSTRDEEYNLIKQALTPPTSDEIVKELNEYYENNYKKETLEKNTNLLGKYQISHVIVHSDYGVIMILPPKLAHKITSFFINEEE